MIVDDLDEEAGAVVVGDAKRVSRRTVSVNRQRWVGEAV